jgi:hypothetical protein
MSPKGTVPDSTDPGTLRPDIAPESATRSHFKPLICPDFDHCTNLPPNLRPNDVFGIWSLFFTKELLEMFVLYTNIKGRAQEPVPSLSNHLAVVLGIHAQDWVDMTLSEMYTYFGILICMALNLINDIKEY